MREQRKRLIGVVTSDKMDKTVTVAVTTAKRHPRYGKVMRLVRKYKAHDEENACQLGDRVQIIESRPISRHKRWAVVSILERAK
ncbi:MAG: 30S ribosomal protein S17 [Ardenticatenaceae bacterium]|nr:30S ribosomal protein S17 [Anaerolineales bacterium]MCB8922595.1 30S ribosomal protein S17 [Ardenticatenaceae bacterium]MCB8991263.1 30S ribosomal protein S17 [Ardenticatenaceae bacterium]MCB9003696.1 30S ribosomal protein S17 [Ardenticatenaceae bacterium]